MHVAILIFVILGWTTNDTVFLIFHMLLVPAIILQWKINQGRCFLTDLEHYLNGELEYSLEKNENTGFVHKLILKYTKTNPNQAQVLKLMYFIMTICFLLSFTKLYFLNI